MFSYNDGALHENVEVIGEFTSFKLDRIPNSTQHVASPAVISKYGQLATLYKYKIDGCRLTEPRFYDPAAMKATKHFYKDVPYLHVVPETAAETLIYIIPGNPGLCEYYYEFVESLARIVPKSEVLVTSYLGYNVDKVVPLNRVIGLDEQVEHKIEFLNFILGQKCQKPKHVVVMGHSVGAWIAQRVAVRNKSVKYVGLLTPTVRNIAQSDRGASFTKLTNYLGARSVYWFIWALNWLPLSSRIISTFMSILLPYSMSSPEAHQASINLSKNPYVCRQIVGMALEEMQKIGDDIEAKDIRGFWDNTKNIWACFAQDDHWVSTETRESLIDYAKPKLNVKIDIVPVPHAFCLVHSESVAGLAAQQIKEWIRK